MGTLCYDPWGPIWEAAAAAVRLTDVYPWQSCNKGQNYMVYVCVVG